MLKPAEVEALLSDLCVRLGFCLPPNECEILRKNPPSDVDAFTKAIFIAEGMNPETADRHLFRQVRAAVANVFQKAESGSPNQPLKNGPPKRREF